VRRSPNAALDHGVRRQFAAHRNVVDIEVTARRERIGWTTVEAFRIHIQFDSRNAAEPAVVAIGHEIAQGPGAVATGEDESFVDVDVEAPMVDGKALHQMVHPEDAEPRSPETLCVREHGDVRFGAQPLH
jgi:hypothetical protein